MKAVLFVLTLALLTCGHSAAYTINGDEYTSRTTYEVSNSGSLKTDVTVSLNRSYDASMNAMMTDSIITDSSDNVLAYHKMFTSPSAFSTYHIEIPSLPNGDTSIYYYYDSVTADNEGYNIDYVGDGTWDFSNSSSSHPYMTGSVPPSWAVDWKSDGSEQKLEYVGSVYDGSMLISPAYRLHFFDKEYHLGSHANPTNAAQSIPTDIPYDAINVVAKFNMTGTCCDLGVSRCFAGGPHGQYGGFSVWTMTSDAESTSVLVPVSGETHSYWVYNLAGTNTAHLHYYGYMCPINATDTWAHRLVAVPTGDLVVDGSSSGAWTTIDVSSHIDGAADGAIVMIDSSAGAQKINIRKTGTSDSGVMLNLAAGDYACNNYILPIASNGRFDYKTSTATNVKIYIVAYYQRCDLTDYSTSYFPQAFQQCDPPIDTTWRSGSLDYFNTVGTGIHPSYQDSATNYTKAARTADWLLGSIHGYTPGRQNEFFRMKGYDPTGLFRSYIFTCGYRTMHIPMDADHEIEYRVNPVTGVNKVLTFTGYIINDSVKRKTVIGRSNVAISIVVEPNSTGMVGMSFCNLNHTTGYSVMLDTQNNMVRILEDSAILQSEAFTISQGKRYLINTTLTASGISAVITSHTSESVTISTTDSTYTEGRFGFFTDDPGYAYSLSTYSITDGVSIAEAGAGGLVEILGIYDNITCEVRTDGSVWSDQSTSGHALQDVTITPTSALTINVTTLTEPVKRYNESADASTYAMFTVGEGNAYTTYVANIFADINSTKMQTFRIKANATGYIKYNATGYGYDRWTEIKPATEPSGTIVIISVCGAVLFGGGAWVIRRWTKKS